MNVVMLTSRNNTDNIFFPSSLSVVVPPVVVNERKTLKTPSCSGVYGNFIASYSPQDGIFAFTAHFAPHGILST